MPERPGLSVTEGARVLEVTRQALSNLINAHSGLSPEMAIRLEKAIDGTAEAWLRMQMNYDFWHARQRESEIEVGRYKAA